MTPAQWRVHKLTPANIRAAWHAFAADHPDCVSLDALPAGPWPHLSPPPLAPDALAALPPPASIPNAWWIGSFSSLSQGARHEGAALDHDARVVSPESAEEGIDAHVAETVAADVGEDDILEFPRGPMAGNCMHAALERVDFADPLSWPAAIEAALREHPQQGLDPGVVERLPRMLGHMLRDVLATPLPVGMALCDLPRHRRLIELEFALPAGRLTAAELADLLREYGYPVPTLSFSVLEGYLRGFIDLVFEHAGRYYVLDWKSNHLGDHPNAYAAPQLALAMEAHAYHLQYLLYTAALHRYLQRRQPGYRYDTHFGGALYLFLRGVRPGWTDPDGRPLGVHFDRPPLALIQRLSALLSAPADLPEAA